jgi:hypothetical protein
VGNVLVAQCKLQEALEAYQQDLTIAQALAEQDKTNSGWQRDQIVSIYKVAATMAKIGDDEKVVQAQELIRGALGLANKYPGTDRQQIIDILNQGLQQLAH